jgi:oxaloacetate decarboxylase beta subunit
MEVIKSIVASFGILNMTMQQGIMIIVALFFLYLSVVKKFEPLLLLGLAFGMLIANLPGSSLSHSIVADLTAKGVSPEVMAAAAKTPLSSYYINPVSGNPGLLNIIYSGIRLVVFPPMIFLCIGSMTDFAPLIASPKSFLIGLGAQFGIFMAMAVSFFAGKYFSPFIPGLEAFTLKEAAAIGIIGGADGPTAVYTSIMLAPKLLPAISIAAFSYMALVPFIQPPLMRLFTTPKERVIVMPEPKAVTQQQRILFPILLGIGVLLLIPAAGALVAMLCLGNLIRESGVAERIAKALQGEFLSIITLFVGFSIGSSATADIFLTPQTLIVLVCGIVAFAFGTVGGIMVAKILNVLSGGKVNPLIGNAGVSAMPMAARISQKMGIKYNPENYLLMHAMGPLVSGTIGSAICSGIFITYFTR